MLKNCLSLAVAAVLLSAPVFAEKTRKARKGNATQQAIERGCVTVSDIAYHGFTFRYMPFSLAATVRSQCPGVANVWVTVAYFDRSGAQLGTDLMSVTLAPGAYTRILSRAADVPTGTGYYVADVGVNRALIIDVQVH